MQVKPNISSIITFYCSASRSSPLSLSPWLIRVTNKKLCFGVVLVYIAAKGSFPCVHSKSKTCSNESAVFFRTL